MKKLYPLLSVLFLFYVSSFSFANTPNLFLNEFLASNSSINLDPDLYNFCDWIEIYNSEDTVVNISGYYITDDLSDPFKFQLPEGLIIQPYSFLIVWADGENFNPGNYLLDPENINVIITTCHLNFKLKKAARKLAYTNQMET